MRVSVYTTSGRKTGTTTLPKEIFGKKVSEKLLAQAVRVYMANQRQAPAKTKSRGEVKTSKRKIWRQKGTGRARHGSRNAPIFVKGAIAHGPRGNQNFSLKMPKKMKRAALLGALTSKADDKKIFVIKEFSKIKPKTKNAQKLIDVLLKKESTRRALVATLGTHKNCKRAFSNLKNVQLMPAKQLNAYQVLKHKYLFLEKGSIKKIKEVFLQPRKP